MKTANLKSKNDRFFLVAIIVFLLMLCILTFAGCSFLVWKTYPTIYLFVNKKITPQKLDFNKKNIDTEKQKKVFVPVKDEIAENITTNYYDISGFTVSELNSQMQTLGPEMTSNERVYAITNNAINWTLPTETDDGCSEIEAELIVEYIMPRWINYSEATLEMQQKWDYFYSLLLQHELEHGKIARQEAEKFLVEIKNLKNYTSCHDFDDKVYPIQEKYLLEMAQKQENYDNETNHGATEGVVLQ